jgi:hypothetical protein
VGLTGSTGDLMVLAVDVNGNVTASISTPSGWTLYGSPTQAGSVTHTTLAIYYKFRQVGDTAPSVSWTGSGKNSGVMVAFSGVDATTPIDTLIPTFNTNSGSTAPQSASLAAATMGACRVHIYGWANTGVPTRDSRMVLAKSQATSATNPANVALEYETGMASDASGTRTSTITSAAWVAATMWLRPATPTTFGLLRSNYAQASGSSVTASLATGDVVNSPTNTLQVAKVRIWSAGTNTVTAVDYASGATSLTEIDHVQAPGSSTETSIWYQYNCTLAGAAASVVAHRGGSDSAEIWVGEFKGAAYLTDPKDAFGHNSGTSTSGTVTSSTPANETQLVVAGFANDLNGIANTPDANYVQRNNNTNGAAGHVEGVAETREVATGGSAQTATCSFGSSGNWGAVIATFRAPSAAVATTPRPVVVSQAVQRASTW